MGQGHIIGLGKDVRVNAYSMEDERKSNVPLPLISALPYAMHVTSQLLQWLDTVRETDLHSLAVLYHLSSPVFLWVVFTGSGLMAHGGFFASQPAP